MRLKVNWDYETMQQKFREINAGIKEDEMNKFLTLQKKDSQVVISYAANQEVIEVRSDWSELNPVFKASSILYGTLTSDGFVDVDTYVPLHTHSEYSILDGANKIADMVKKYPHSGAITDHGVMYGCVDFYKNMHQRNKKAIIGCEVYMESIDSSPEKDHLIALATNDIGYYNLCKLCTKGQEHYGGKFPKKPLVTYAELEQYKEGIIILSACIGGELPQRIIDGNSEAITKIIDKMLELFGDNYYFEIQRHASKELTQEEMDRVNIERGFNYTYEEYMKFYEDMPSKEFTTKFSKHLHRSLYLDKYEPIVNEKLIALSKQYGIPLVATNDAHYLNKEDADIHEILLCNQTATTLSNPNRLRFSGTGYHIHTTEEMEELFADIPEAIYQSLAIANKCTFEYQFGHYQLPNFPVPEGETPMSYLRILALEGFQERYAHLSPTSQDYKDRLERIHFELDVIEKMGYQTYFLVVWDYVNFAKTHGIAVGPGRGSGAGSEVNYCLHITEQLDPIAYDLLFERFLNPDRISMPDIDLDFEYERREEVIQYTKEKYGPECVSRIITFGRMAAKSCILDVGRILEYPVSLVRPITKFIPNQIDITIASALEMSEEFATSYETDDMVHQIVDIALRLEGLVKNTSQHACGVIISNADVSNYCPQVFTRSDDSDIPERTSQFVMIEVEEIGLLKMDFLGLRTESVIHESIQDINRIHNTNYGLYDIPINDPKVYELLATGKTNGVFQLESGGMTSTIVQLYQDVYKKISEIQKLPESLQKTAMEELGNQCFDRLIAGISLYRPGPMDFIPKYIEGIMDESTIRYKTPELQPILKDTYGVIVYQEQVMKVVRALAGFTPGQSDEIRKAMSKKKAAILEQYRPFFVKGSGDAIDSHTGKKYGIVGCAANHINESIADSIYNEMIDFAKYAFNKSHAAAYAVISAQTAWINTYYPVIFMKANLNTYITNTTKLKSYLGECQKRKITMLPPSVNESDAKFTLNEDGSTIRFGLKGIKDVGKASRLVLLERELRGKFDTYQDFLERMIRNHNLNRKAVIALIYAGAFDEFPGSRQSKVLYLDESLEIVKSCISKQYPNIFDLAKGLQVSTKEILQLTIPETAEFPKLEKLAKEIEFAGFYITGHPLDDYQIILSKENLMESYDFMEQESEESNIKIAGVITGLERKNFTSGNGYLYKFSIVDRTGEIPCVCWSKEYEKNSAKIEDGNLVMIQGDLKINDFGVQMQVENVSYLSMSDDKISSIQVYCDKSQQVANAQYTNLCHLLSEKSGDTPIVVIKQGERVAGVPNGLDLSLASFEELQGIFRENNCKINFAA